VEAAMIRFTLLFLLTVTLNAQVLIDHYRFGSGGGNNLLTGLQAHWTFDQATGNATDSTINARDFVENGTVAQEVDAALGTSRLFNGLDDADYFSIPDAAWQELTNADFTITVWFKPQVDPEIPEMSVIQDSVIYSKSGGTGDSYILNLDRGAWANTYAFQFYYSEDGGIPFQLMNVEVDSEFGSDFWYFIYVKREGNNFTMGYTKKDAPTLSSTLKDTETQAITFFDTTGPLVAAGWLTGSSIITSHDPNGAIDEMTFYNVAKSDCELLKLFRLTPYSSFNADPCE
jgi:hypothetical protein